MSTQSKTSSDTNCHIAHPQSEGADWWSSEPSTCFFLIASLQASSFPGISCLLVKQASEATIND